jgi:hypothetical protein
MEYRTDGSVRSSFRLTLFCLPVLPAYRDIGRMRRLLDSLPWPSLLLFAAVLAILPLQPEPHLVQKARWLIEARPFALIDIFDVVMHLSGIILVVLKLAFRNRRTAQ